MADKKYGVTLSAHGNIDNGENPYKPLNGLSLTVAQGDTIKELQQIVKDYIHENQLGRGNWTGGQVYDRATEELIGEISYNGRYWENDLSKPSRDDEE